MALTSTMSNKCSSLSVFDENFGMGLDFNNIKRQFREWVEKQSTSYPVSKNNDASATVSTLNDKFQVTIDVYQFKSEEITIKVIGSNTICIEGNHEEQHEDAGFLSRHFLRKYTVPNGYDIKNVVSSLSSDGILRIIAPRNGETIDDYRNVAIQQTNVSSHNKKQTQYNEENIQKQVSGYHEVPVQQKNRQQEISIQQNQQTHSNKKESNVAIAQTTKDFEEIHNSIQQFLRSIDNRCKDVPIQQVGPFAKINERETNLDSQSLQIQETYKNQQGYRNVPIQKTTASYSSSVETQSKKQIESSDVLKSNQMKVCETRTTESSNANKHQNRKCSIDSEETHFQKEVERGYKTVPIVKTGVQSQNSITKNTSEETKIQNWETNTNKSNNVQDYKIVPVEQTFAQRNDDIHEQRFTKHNSIEVEETKTYKNENQSKNTHNYKNIPIQQTGNKLASKDLSNTENIERHIHIVDSTLARNIPIEQIQGDKINTNIKKTTTSEESNKQEIYESNYKTIPVKQIGAASQNIQTNEYEKTLECNITKKQNLTNSPQESRRVPNKQYVCENDHSNDVNSTIQDIKTIEEIETWEIHNNKTTLLSDKSKNITHEQNIFRNNSIDSQGSVKNKTDIEETEHFERVNRKQGHVNTSQERKTIEQVIPKETNNIKTNVEEKKFLNEQQNHNSKIIPTEQIGTVTQESKYETHEQKMFKTSSIDSQHNFEETENWKRNLKTSHPTEETSSSKITYEQELRNNLNSTNNINKKYEADESKRNSESYSNSSKTSEYKQSLKNLQQTSKSDDYNCTQINNRSSTEAAKEKNNSSLQSNLNQKNELSTLQNQGNLMFHESDSSKEDFVRDGYKQSSLTNKNAKAEFVALPDGFKVTNEQSFYSEQSKTKEWNSDKSDKLAGQSQNNAYQVQFSVDSNSGERYSRMPSETSEICIEEVTEENESKSGSRGTTGYRRHESSQFSSNSDHTVHVQQN